MGARRSFPVFHSKGTPRGDFYVLSFVEGLYVPSSDKVQKEAFLLVNFSPSNEFTRFSYEICALDGRMMAYIRGNDCHDSLEAVLLIAWYRYEMPPHLWSLFPKSNINVSSFKNGRHAKQYAEARLEFCALLYHLRQAGAIRDGSYAKRYKFKHPKRMFRFFRFKQVPKPPKPWESHVENQEIAEAVMTFWRRLGR